jgi:hypothetical protein
MLLVEALQQDFGLNSLLAGEEKNVFAVAGAVSF